MIDMELVACDTHRRVVHKVVEAVRRGDSHELLSRDWILFALAKECGRCKVYLFEARTSGDKHAVRRGLHVVPDPD